MLPLDNSVKIHSGGWIVENLCLEPRSSGSPKDALPTPPLVPMGVIDTLLCRDGSLKKWVFTNRFGRICKKIQMDQQSLSARFLVNSSCLDGSRGSVAILRLSDGTSRVLSESAFKEAMNVFPSVMRSVVAIQPFLQGAGPMKIVHRCHYFVSDNAGRVACQTGSITTTSALSASLQKGVPHLNLRIVWDDGKCSNPHLVDSEVDGVISELTETTKRIVQYVEAMQSQPTRILDVELDFSVDKDGKIWLLWSGSVSIVKGTTTIPQDLELGQQTVCQQQRSPIESEVVAVSPRRRGVRRRIMDSAVLDEAKRRPEFDYQEPQAMKLHSEVTVMPTYETETAMVPPRTVSKNASRCILSNGKECAGNFCFCSISSTHEPVRNINTPKRHEDDVTGRGDGYGEAKGKTEVIMKHFSAQELSVLKQNRAFRKNIIEGQLDKLQEAEATYSGGQARELNTVHERKVLWKSITKARERSDKCRKGGESTNQGIQRPTETSTIRHEGVRRKRGENNTATSDLYDFVTVCSTCFYVYTALDQATRILNDKSTSRDVSMSHQALLASNLLGERADHYPVESPTTTQSLKLPEKGVINIKRSNTRSSPSAWKVQLGEEKDRVVLFPESSSISRSPTQNSYSYHQQQKQESDRVMPSSQQRRQEAIEPYQPLGPLDEYLRGLAKLQTSNNRFDVAPNNPAPPHLTGKKDGEISANKQTSAPKKKSSKIIDTASTRASHKGMLVGHILVGESDPIVSSSIREILENAGYVVTIIGDGKRALELLIPSDKDNTSYTTVQKEIQKKTPQDKVEVKNMKYDAALLSTDSLLVMDALSVTMVLRESEKFRRSKAQGVLSQAVRSEGVSSLPKGGSPAVIVATSKPIPIIAFAKVENTKADDLRKYMTSGMDGCVTKPIEKEALLSTIKAAVPHHLTRKAKESRKQEQITKVSMVKGLGFLEKSAAKAAVGMPVARGESKEDFIHGIMRVDVDTEITYCVVGSRLRMPSKSKIDNSPIYNLVICHDIFDHYEKLKILLMPIMKRCPGAQVLLWNYPGQAYTKWRENQIINNEYLASILSKLLDHTKSLGQFEETMKGEVSTTTTPFHLVGYGIGAAVACFYASHYPCPNLRSIVSINGFSYIDPHHAGVLRDCTAVFKECPETRLDLPYYFYARYLFSPQYLHRVTPSLALNIYTAIHNPISLAGRVALCDGTLCMVDLRPVMAEIDVPIICLQSTEGRLICKNHLEPFTTRGVKDGGCEVQSIHMALLGGKSKRKEGPSKLPSTAKTCVIWVKSGHEVFQEARSKVLTILEEMIKGHYEYNDVVYKNEPSSPSSKNNPLGISEDRVQEESFIENVLHLSRERRNEETLSSQGIVDSHKQQQILSASSKRGGGSGDMNDVITQPPISVCELEVKDHGIPIGKAFGETQKFLSRKQQEISTNHLQQQQRHSRRCRSPKKNVIDEEISAKKSYLDKSHNRSQKILSPTRQGRKSNLAHSPEKCIPEFREYMNWRLERNKKKLSWMESAAVKIQSVARGHQARKCVKRKRERLAALCIQQTFRGRQARLKVLEGLRCIRAAQIIQHYWRAYAGRHLFMLYKNQHNAATAISCAWRGKMSRQRRLRLVEKRDLATAVIQALYRGRKGRKEAFSRKKEKTAAISIQRIYRGYLGRNKASRERDKYMFSIAQSAGVEFGRQMLLEHKLHATRLQSEVAVLSNEKIETEKVVEELLEEISRFEEGVATLESEMHQLGRVEVEAGVILDQDALFDLREQKTLLDSEFGTMLGKISDRKERLSRLETKLARFDQERLTKEQELRSLERKLVVLLEEQQRELEYIRSRQETKANSSTVVNTTHEDRKESSRLRPQHKTDSRDTTCCGPSTKDKQQAAQLMQSTETLMKFGFMSMSMTYFSSLNMIRAMRKVGATDTVMGALVKVQQDGDAAINSSGSGGIEERTGKEAAMNMSYSGPESLTAVLKPGQVPGSQPLRVSAWSVDDVGRWLQCLSLSQYQSALAEAAVDGALLYDLNEDDLKNTLGIDHRLHRKKIVKAIERLKNAEMEHQKQTALNIAQGHLKQQEVKPQSAGFGERNTTQFGNAMDAMGIVAAENGDDLLSQSIRDDNKLDGSFGGVISLSFSKLAPMVRHKKLKALRHALERVPEKRFVSSLVQQQYVPDVGTVYISQYEAQAFHMNQAGKHGNTLFLLAAQNGSVKIAKLLLSKGANPNHQNTQGQTAGHYATTYQFFDFAEWLYDTNGAAANDSLQNFHELGPYDGLSPDMSSEDHQLISGENSS